MISNEVSITKQLKPKHSNFTQFIAENKFYYLEILSCLVKTSDTTYLSFIKLFETNVSNFKFFYQ